MLPRLKYVYAGILGALAVAVALTNPPARAVAIQPVAEADDGPDVLARGPVHEAFASTVGMPNAGEIAPKAPPELIEELPPDQKPEGDNVQWIPGYWDWDDERTDFIWISGFWRVPPPNHVWVPGSWNRVVNGWQWTSGFWQLTQPNQPQPELEYFPPPPQSIEVGPSVIAPDETSVYVTGSWVWRERYVWRPGFWIAHRPGWIWVPAHYRWTPLGYVFINGYWDYPLANRGVLFTPVYFSDRRAFRPGYFYTPRYVVSVPILFGSLFSRRGYSSYYFGDYYGANYGRGGYQPWLAGGFRQGFGGVPNRGWNYDPLWNYYSVNNRRDPQWSTNLGTLYTGRYDGTVSRPPRTLVQQNQLIQRAANINNVSNVTNNVTVVNNNITVNNRNVTEHVMVAPLAIAPQLQSETRLQPISQQVRQTEAKNAVETRQVGINRQRAEGDAVKARPPVAVPAPGVAPTPPQPVRVKLDVPKAAVAQAQIPDEKRQPPPVPVQPKFDPKIEPKFNPMPKVEPKINPMPKGEPKINPMPKVDPKINPMPKVDPKINPMPKGEIPKVDPKPMPMPKGETPKVDPKPMPMPKGETPKVDPKPMPKPKGETPKKVDPPSVEPPKQPVVPQPPPRVDPPRQPKVDPPKQPVVPQPPPRVEPPKQPVVPQPPPRQPPPKVEPPKQPVVPQPPPRVEPPRQPPPRVEPPRQPVVPQPPPPPRQPPPRVEPPVVPQPPPPPRQPPPRVEPPKQPVVPQPPPPRAEQPRQPPPRVEQPKQPAPPRQPKGEPGKQPNPGNRKN